VNSAAGLEFPPPPGASSARWIGTAFAVGNEHRRILSYGSAPSGWTDELTDLHESAAGADHFIDVASRAHAVREVARVAGHPGAVVLEVGISSGFLLREMIARLPAATFLGADYTLGTLQKAATRLPADVPLLQFDLTECPLPDASVDAVVLLNVLEHIEHDAAALRQLHRIVKPGGAAIIEVPAGEGLFDRYDEALMHWRRYSMSALARRVTAAGFRIERRSHLGFFLYPGFYAAKKFGRTQDTPKPALDASVEKSISWSRRLGAVASASLVLEGRLRTWAYLPFGIRCLITGRKTA
jgi:SAM-dependent methyltransferase